MLKKEREDRSDNNRGEIDAAGRDEDIRSSHSMPSTNRANRDITANPIKLLQGQSSMFGAQLLHALLFDNGDAMKSLVRGMLATSVAVATLVGAEASYAGESPDATYGGQDRGTAVATEATGEEGSSGPRVRVQPRIQDLTPSLVQDEKKMEPELDAIAKESPKLESQICPGC